MKMGRLVPLAVAKMGARVLRSGRTQARTSPDTGAAHEATADVTM
jgi:hypothetical protein